jgi:hypothetical protein
MKKFHQESFESSHSDEFLYKAALNALSKSERESLKLKLLEDSQFREKFCDFLKIFSRFEKSFQALPKELP